MRVGTWNLDGRWDERRAAFVHQLRCDLLLLTEVRHDVAIEGHRLHRTTAEMVAGRAWAAVAAPDLCPLPDPHAATAAALVEGVVVCASVLPWNGCGGSAPWQGRGTTERTERAVSEVVGARPQVWGGDWNHAMRGPERAGSLGGRAAISAALERLALAVPTAELPHHLDGLLTIDHVAVPDGTEVASVERHVAEEGGRRLSDHDAYVAEVGPLTAGPSVAP